MMSRAFIVLRDAPFTIDAGANSDIYQHLSHKPNPLLDAYFRIALEYRNCLKCLEDNRGKGCDDHILAEHQRRANNDTSLIPEDQAQLDTTEDLAKRRTRQRQDSRHGVVCVCGNPGTRSRAGDRALNMSPDFKNAELALGDPGKPHRSAAKNEGRS